MGKQFRRPIHRLKPIVSTARVPFSGQVTQGQILRPASSLQVKAVGVLDVVVKKVKIGIHFFTSKALAALKGEGEMLSLYIECLFARLPSGGLKALADRMMSSHLIMPWNAASCMHRQRNMRST